MAGCVRPGGAAPVLVEEDAMGRNLVTVICMAAFVFSACTSGGGGASPAGSPGASAPAGETPAASSAFDPASVSGTVVFSGWQASEEEGAALEEALAGFKAAYPNITVDYQPVAGDYPASMTAKFSAGEPPDLFYVDSSVAPEWIDQDVLVDLEPLATERGFDTLSLFTSERSPGCDRLRELAASIDAFDMWTPGIAPPQGAAERGLYVDQVYF